MEPSDVSADIGHIAPLDSDNIPNENQAHYCFSCEEPMRGAYCIACGQKNDNMRRGVFSLIWELITSVTAIEGRIWRTWRALILQPGRVARDYANGRRTYWSSPIRVYLAMSILLFAFMGLTNTHLFGIDLNVEPKEGIEKTETDLTADDLSFKFSTKWFPRQKYIDAINADKNYDLIALKVRSFTSQDILSAEDVAVVEAARERRQNNTNKDPAPDGSESGITDNVANEDDNFNIDALNIKISNRDLDSSRAADLLIRFSRNPTILTNSFNKWLPRLIFILMPFTVLFSALFIRGRGNAMLYDHIVHAAYLHAIAFLLLFMGIVLSQFLPPQLILNFLFIALLIYLPVSLKRMFGRGWVKTIWTSYGVGFTYLIILITSLSIAIIVDVGKTVTI